MKRHLVLLLLGFVMMFPPFAARAQQADFEVKPSKLDLMIKPGTSYSASFVITNYGDPNTFIPKVLTASPDEKQGALLPDGEVKGPLKFHFPNSHENTGEPVFLNSNQSVTVQIGIEAQSGEQRDYYYYFLVEPEKAAGAEGKTTAQIVPQIGVPIIITLTDKGERDVKGNITVFQIRPSYSLNLLGRQVDIVETGAGVPVFLVAGNTGANFINPSGKITVSGAFGNRAEFPILSRNVYAHSTRLMLTKSSYEKFCPDKDECRRFSMVLNGFLLGKYELSSSLVWTNGAGQSTKTITFFAFPLQSFAAISVFVIIYIIYHRRRKKKAKHSGSS